MQADLLLTDPPYNVDYEGKTDDALKIKNDKMENDAFYTFLEIVFQNAYSSIRDGAAVYIFHANMQGVNFINAFRRSGLHLAQILIWNKNVFALGHCDYQWKHEPIMYGWKEGAGHFFTDSRCETTVINEDKPIANNEHPTMKPVRFIAYLICNSSRKGETVLDLFGGSGSTLIACEQTNRKCRMIELDEKYCDVIIKRWETFTGRKAVLINT